MRARSTRGSLLLPVALAALAACGGAPSPDHPGGAGGAPSAESPRAEAASPPRGAGPLTEAECMQLLDHYIDLAMAEKKATLPPEQVPTDEQVARIRTDMRQAAAENCIGKAERSRYECAMQARTTRGVGVCLAGEREGGG